MPRKPPKYLREEAENARSASNELLLETTIYYAERSGSDQADGRDDVILEVWAIELRRRLIACGFLKPLTTEGTAHA